MKLSIKYAGFSVVQIIVVVLVVGIIGALGYVAYDRIVLNKTAEVEVVEQSPTADDVKSVYSVPEVNSSAELSEVETMLDELDTSSADDSALIDSETNNF